MSSKFNRVGFTTSTTGTGTITVGSGISDATNGDLLTPAQAGIADGTKLSYVIISGHNWCTGVGTYTASGTTLSRDAAEQSWNGTSLSVAALSLTGTSSVYLTALAVDFDNPELSGVPSTPPPNRLALGVDSLGGSPTLLIRNANGPARNAGYLLSRLKYVEIVGLHASNSPVFGVYGTGIHGGSRYTTTSAVASTGTALATTNFFTRQPRGSLLTASTPGSLAMVYPSNSLGLMFTMGTGGSAPLGGFCHIGRGGFADTVSGARAFAGLCSDTTASTNINPATMTNCIGIAQVDGSNNLNIVYGGSAAQTPIDLGANFPANTASTDWYEWEFTSSSNDNSKITYRVRRWSGSTGDTPDYDTGVQTITNTTPGTTLPAKSTFLNMRAWRCNNATASAAAFHITNMACYAES